MSDPMNDGGVMVTAAEVFDQLRNIDPNVLDLAIARAQRDKAMGIIESLQNQLMEPSPDQPSELPPEPVPDQPLEPVEDAEG